LTDYATVVSGTVHNGNINAFARANEKRNTLFFAVRSVRALPDARGRDKLSLQTVRERAKTPDKRL